MSTPAALIAADHISVLRQGRAILNDVSLNIGERDFITVIGPNGAGKSMLLKCLMGFFPPDQGSITRREGVRFGYVPQRLVADPALPMTARRFLRLRTQADAAAVLQAAEETAIRHVLDTPLHLLSGGELQRVLLARALLGNPDLLVLDEPAQNLDISGQLGFYRPLERIWKERALSILMVSHDLHLVMASSKQVICLYHHVCCSGEPHAVARDPEFIALFGDDMARMMAVYTHSHDHEHHEHHQGACTP
jgi:zinc transport system ATP-binding protein